MILQPDFIQTGSRRVLTGRLEYVEKLAGADFDYACPDTPKNIEWLKNGGYIQKAIQEDYMDSATTGVWELGSTQVATKSQEMWKQVVIFWEIMQAHPELFIDQIWKRGEGISSCNGDKSTITQNINNWLNILSVKHRDHLTFLPMTVEELYSKNYGVTSGPRTI